MHKTWLGASLDLALFGMEMQRVIALRLLTLAGGGAAAQREANRMVAEKGAAFAEAAMTLAMGGSHKKVARRYRTHVRANARRLSRRRRKR
jgi:hypothetical protein